MGKKKGKNTKNKVVPVETVMIEKDINCEEYAIVTKKLGGGRFLLRLNMKNTEIVGRLCGKMRYRKAKRKNWVDVDSVVLVGLRDFQDNVVDIVHVYDSDEAKELRKSGKFIEETRLKKVVDDNEEEFMFDFEDI